MTNPSLILAPAVARAINLQSLRAARRLRRYGYDSNDARQELILHWLRRRASHDARRSAPQTFAADICRRRAISMLKSHIAVKRGGGMVYTFSEMPAMDQNAQPIERPEQVSVDSYECRLGLRSRPQFEMDEMRTDLDRVIAGLPPHLANLASRLKIETVTSAALSTGISRATANRYIAQIRKAFFDAGLNLYLGCRVAPEDRRLEVE